MDLGNFYDSENLQSVKYLVKNGRPVNSDLRDAIRQDYEKFCEELEITESEGALHFMASSGYLANSYLDSQGQKDKVFEEIRDALGSRKSRLKTLMHRVSTGDWWYKGVSETDLWNAYNKLDASTEQVT